MTDPIATHLISGGIQRIAEELARLMRACHPSLCGYQLPRLDEREASVHPIARARPMESAFTFEEQRAQFRKFAADMDPGTDNWLTCALGCGKRMLAHETAASFRCGECLGSQSRGAAPTAPTPPLKDSGSVCAGHVAVPDRSGDTEASERLVSSVAPAVPDTGLLRESPPSDDDDLPVDMCGARLVCDRERGHDDGAHELARDDNPTLATMPLDYDHSPETAWCDGFECAMNYRDDPNWAELPAPLNPYHPANCAACRCNRASDPSMPHERLCPFRDGPKLTPCARCLAPHEAHDGIGGESCGRCLALDEATAELLRVKAENGRLETELTEASRQALLFNRALQNSAAAEYRAAHDLSCYVTQHPETLAKLTESERLVSELRAELAKREAVVAAAREVSGLWRDCVARPYTTLREALSALDQSQPEPVREIMVDSKWRRIRDAIEVHVEGIGPVRDKGAPGERIIAYGKGEVFGTDLLWRFLQEFTHVSDPPPVGESGVTSPPNGSQSR